MKFPKIKKKKKNTGIKSLKLETDISKLLNILQKKFGKSKGGIVEILKLAAGGFPRKMGMINGPGTGTSDSIPAMLSDGEFVMTANAVKGFGNGSRDKGAKVLQGMMKKAERSV
jgi:hypothetical protein